MQRNFNGTFSSTELSIQRNFQFNGMFTPTELFHDGRFSVLRFQVLLVIN